MANVWRVANCVAKFVSIFVMGVDVYFFAPAAGRRVVFVKPTEFAVILYECGLVSIVQWEGCISVSFKNNPMWENCVSRFVVARLFFGPRVFISFVIMRRNA